MGQRSRNGEGTAALRVRRQLGREWRHSRRETQGRQGPAGLFQAGGQPLVPGEPAEGTTAMSSVIDLRSDTLTKPTPAMRAAMAAADVGDDVYGEDPTVNALEAKVAAFLGKEAALFVPSGSMSNQIAVKTHTQPGDELICEEFCHIYNWEAGGPAFLSGVTSRTVRAEFGIIELDQLRDKIRPINDHMVRTRLVCLENTHNRGGGRIFPIEQVRAISTWAR